MIKIFQLSIKDFLTKKFLILSFLPFFCAILILSAFMIFGGNEIFDALNQGAKTGDFNFLNEDKYPFLAKILTYKITRWIISAIFYTLASFLVVIFSVIMAAIIAGFLTPIISKDVNLKYYNIKIKNQPKFARILRLMIKEILIFLLLFLLSLPFLFIPIINIFVLNIPFFYLYHKFMLLDVASNTLEEYRFEILYKKSGGYMFIFACLIFYIVSLVPFLGVFLQIFFVINLSHILLNNECRLCKI
ncbi:hypothetical protein F1B92_02930 [Campylobacter sp. FMV-PI01]|uniref:EI24 domain-containing protein n=1 Tax=Campylobacter portucalensis TaxID=2608384 RepID=A0A6L5WG80_9BACT|nr:EI24 domain-containing protein [Campylobacter portucalensis]MSN96158.1 hypothetical protein [Campylobacter portucalensis]